jgi:hypothetical protein
VRVKNMVLKTAEIRWFHRGAPPAEVRRYFEDGEQESRERTDLYLTAPGIAGLGVKLREGRIELKQLTGREPGSARLPWLNGWIEHHRKWSFSLADADAAAGLTGAPGTDSPWIAVEKSRLLQLYEIHADGEVGQVPDTVSRPGFSGCSLELVSLSVRGDAWWSLGLEAVGADGRRVGNLIVLLTRARQMLALPPYSVDRSCGYARWLISHYAAHTTLPEEEVP